ncbi:MAG: isoprenylcysteine carboxylmethyltransferase family protein [Oscillospiraceae bacterium]|nr:isoprenylcysteine carboxylmethyltransferase family protein [Oscillospiraceae bacterium]
MVLFRQAIVKFLSGLLAVALLLFLPAGTFAYWQAWLLIGVLFLPMFVAGLVLLRRSPALLRRRLDAREEQREQKSVILLSGLMFLAAFVLAGLGRRLQWSTLPPAVSWVAAAAFLLAYALYAEVLRENAYLSRTVGVEEGQQLVDTGLYGVVRHPMYTSTVLLFLAMPLILGSLPAFAVTLLYIPIIVRRIRNEERVLEAGLPGYAEYERRVPWRLLPRVW